MAITGKDLIEAGCKPGKWFGPAVVAANAALSDGYSYVEAMKAALLLEPAPAVPVHQSGTTPFFSNIAPENEIEAANVAAVTATMAELMRTPVVTAGAIMPDACPAGSLGVIPVGGIAASTEIHPGMHSADICCSVMISVFDGTSPLALLDAVHSRTHFGPGGRTKGVVIRMGSALAGRVWSNEITRSFIAVADTHFATQGDGNHFAFVGTLRSTGQTALVTHHGSRGFGAGVYKAGMRLAERHRMRLSPETLKANAWIPADTKDGDDYWQALRIVREWTKASHQEIHLMARVAARAKSAGSCWNEHNFVFRKSDGLFYHGKGATPAWADWAHDAADLTLIPLNMAEPVLIVRGLNADHALGFSPHGAGRNFSRTAHKRSMAGRTDAEILAEETQGIDARFFCGVPDISELPSAYKNAASVRAQIETFGLAEIVDEVIPYGCIMAGDWEINAPWRTKKAN